MTRTALKVFVGLAVVAALGLLAHFTVQGIVALHTP
jgi:hypothetical protein